MEQEIIFNFRQLLPDLATLLEGNFSSPEGFSAMIVAFLGIVFGLSLWWAIDGYIKAFQATGFYLRLLEKFGFDDKAIKVPDWDKLTKSRHDMLNEAQKSPYYGGKLWREFDESLVMSPDGSRLSNTLDAAHFFNTHTLARRLTESRLLAAVPGFLIAIGVIGTFAGLQMGLSNLNLESSQEVADIRAGIGAVTAGAAIAFMTSVWGVFSSLVFNIIEKCLERHARHRIAKLQNRIDFLYPRIIADQSLVRIADYSRQSHNLLHGLAEQIGVRMQEAMAEATSGMSKALQEALEAILAPAVKTLVDNANSSSETALRNIVSDFTEKLGEGGKEQRALLNETTDKINDATQGLANRLEDFSKAASAQKDEMADAFAKLTDTLATKVEDINQVASAREQQRHQLVQQEFALMHKANEDAVGTLMSGVEKQLAEMGDSERQRSEAMAQRIEAVGATQDELVRSIARQTDNQKQVHEDIIGQLRSIQDGYDKSLDAQQSASEAIRNAATQMREVSTQIEHLGASLQQSAAELGENVGAAASQTKEVAAQSERISENLGRLSDEYKEISETIASVVEKLDTASRHAKEGFEAVDSNLDKFRQQLARQVQELEDQMSKLMLEFAERVKTTTADRMNQWNQQTSKYTSDMTNAVQALAGVVDEIEQKRGQNRRAD